MSAATYRPSGVTVAGLKGKAEELPVRQGSWRGERRKERFMTQSGRKKLENKKLENPWRKHGNPPQ